MQGKTASSTSVLIKRYTAKKDINPNIPYGASSPDMWS